MALAAPYPRRCSCRSVSSQCSALRPAPGSWLGRAATASPFGIPRDFAFRLATRARAPRWELGLVPRSLAIGRPPDLIPVPPARDLDRSSARARFALPCSGAAGSPSTAAGAPRCSGSLRSCPSSSCALRSSVLDPGSFSPARHPGSTCRASPSSPTEWRTRSSAASGSVPSGPPTSRYQPCSTSRTSARARGPAVASSGSASCRAQFLTSRPRSCTSRPVWVSGRRLLHFRCG